MRKFGIDVHASLMLTSTTLDLSQRMTPTSGAVSSGISSGGNPGTSTGNTQGAGSGSGPSSNSGTNPHGSGYDPGSGSTTTGTGGSANPAPSKPAIQSAGLLPWIYEVLGIIAAAIVASGVWISRKRMKKSPALVLPAKPSN
jgi:hypothetical protein